MGQLRWMNVVKGHIWQLDMRCSLLRFLRDEKRGIVVRVLVVYCNFVRVYPFKLSLCAKVSVSSDSLDSMGILRINSCATSVTVKKGKTSSNNGSTWPKPHSFSAATDQRLSCTNLTAPIHHIDTRLSQTIAEGGAQSINKIHLNTRYAVLPSCSLWNWEMTFMSFARRYLKCTASLMISFVAIWELIMLRWRCLVSI